MTVSFPLLSTCPRVRKRRGRLIVASAWPFLVATLGLTYRQMIVDPKQKAVIIRRRFAWFFRRGRRIPFRSIEAVTYGYRDMAGPSLWAHDSVDLFSVGLRLLSGKEIHLFHFYGDGTFTNDGPWPDWLYWQEYLFDFSGTQERESRAFVDLLSKMIGVPVVPPRI